MMYKFKPPLVLKFILQNLIRSFHFYLQRSSIIADDGMLDGMLDGWSTL